MLPARRRPESTGSALQRPAPSLGSLCAAPRLSARVSPVDCAAVFWKTIYGSKRAVAGTMSLRKFNSVQSRTGGPTAHRRERVLFKHVGIRRELMAAMVGGDQLDRNAGVGVRHPGKW